MCLCERLRVCVCVCVCGCVCFCACVFVSFESAVDDCVCKCERVRANVSICVGVHLWNNPAIYVCVGGVYACVSLWVGVSGSVGMNVRHDSLLLRTCVNNNVSGE